MGHKCTKYLCLKHYKDQSVLFLSEFSEGCLLPKFSIHKSLWVNPTYHMIFTHGSYLDTVSVSSEVEDLTYLSILEHVH